MRAWFSLAATILSLVAFSPPDTEATWKKELRFFHQDSFEPIPVVLVVFDELPLASLITPSGNIDGRLFPRFARLQRESIWFRNATSTRTFTAEALPAILTGTSPTEQVRVRLGSQPRNLFTLMGDAYEIRADENLPQMCPAGECDGGGTQELSGRVLDRLGRFADGDRGRHVVSFLKTIEPGDEPVFYFLHLIMPHAPWRYFADGQRYDDPVELPGELRAPGRGRVWANDGWLVTQAYQRHLLQTALVDRILGTIIDRLKETRIYNRSLLLVAADHGGAFLPGHSKRSVDADTAGHLAPVPLFLKLPQQQRGSISDLPVQLTDVAPTIADVLDLSDTGGDFEGTSALDGSIDLDRARVVSDFPLDPAGTEKYAVARIKYELFERGEQSLDLFALGPDGTGELVGRPVSSFAVTSATGPSVHLPTLEKVELADPAAPGFPAFFEGSLQGETEGDATIVLTVNGVIAAVTRTYEDADATRFFALMSPRFFGPPPNDIAVYLLGSDRASLVAVPTS